MILESEVEKEIRAFAEKVEAAKQIILKNLDGMEARLIQKDKELRKMGVPYLKRSAITGIDHFTKIDTFRKKISTAKVDLQACAETTNPTYGEALRMFDLYVTHNNKM